MKNTGKIIAAGLLIVAMLGACRKDQMDKAANTAAQDPNTMTVKMTDNPGDYLALNMEIDKVEVYLQDSGWVELSSATQFVDIATLTNGNSAKLASKGHLKAGKYTKAKVTFGSHNKLTLLVDATDGSGTRVASETDIAFDGSKEIIVEIDAEIDANHNAEVLVDFDIVKSIAKGISGYLVKPALKFIKDEKTGIQGEVRGTLTATIVVSDGNDSVTALTDLQGHFLIRGIKPGVYTVIVYPAKKLIKDLLQKPVKIEGVVVAEGEIKYLGGIDIN